MSLESIDKGMIKKLKSVYPNVLFSPLSQALSNGAGTLSTNEDEGEIVSSEEQTVKLPLIVFDRVNNPLMRHKPDTLTRRGRYVVHDGDEFNLASISVDVMYQIDIISDRRLEVDGIWRELVYYLLNNPNLLVKFEMPGSDPIEETFTISVLESDNTTDVEDFQNRGRVWRTTINIEIADAALYFKKSVNLIQEIPTRLIQLDE